MSRWHAWAERFDELNRRERLLLTLTLSTALLALLYVFWLEPLAQSLAKADKQTRTAEQQITQWQEQIALYNNQPVPRVEARLNQLKEQLAEHDQQLDTLALELMPPQRMTPVLREVLALTGDQVRLIRLSKAAPEEIHLQAEQNTETTQAPVALYRHTLSVELQAGFGGLQKFLQHLEQQAPGLFWDQLELTSENYPDADIILQLHTLSIEEGWLGA